MQKQKYEDVKQNIIICNFYEKYQVSIIKRKILLGFLDILYPVMIWKNLKWIDYGLLILVE